MGGTPACSASAKSESAGASGEAKKTEGQTRGANKRAKSPGDIEQGDEGDEDWAETVDVGGGDDDDDGSGGADGPGSEGRAKISMVKKRDPPNAWKKRCADGTCLLGASFGMEGQSAMYCSAHKDAGMVNVTHRRCRERG